MIHFDWPWLLLALPLPLLVYLLPAKTKGQTSALRVPVVFANHPRKTICTQTSYLAKILLPLIWCLVVLAASRPQWLGEPINLPTKGREMMIAVDLSYSMHIEDMVINNRAVNRLVMVKHVLSDFIQRRVGDRLGLILFADDAYMQTPMTFDRNTVQKMLNEAVLGLVGNQTAIGDAIGLAVKRFNNKAESNRILILLTDGENTSGKLTPDEALELAITNNVTIYTIGIGADEYAINNKNQFGLNKNFYRKISGHNRKNQIDENTLTAIAEKTGGKYFRAYDSETMAEIYQLLDELEPIDQQQQQMRPLTALFYWPLAFALILALFYLCKKTLHVSSLKFSLNRSDKEQNHG